MMTRQEMADFVVEKLAGQNFVQSARLDGLSCLYRGPNGIKCAAGHLIPDNIYKTDFEGEVVDTLVCNHPEVLPCLECSDDKKPGRTASSLQAIHDSCEIPRDMIAVFRLFYLENNLDIMKFEQIVLDYRRRTEKEGE